MSDEQRAELERLREEAEKRWRALAAWQNATGSAGGRG